MIKENVQKLLASLPENIDLVAATKQRNIPEILEAIQSGIKIIGENYVKEAEEKYAFIGQRVLWHLIGHVQRNKAKRAVKIFDMIETLDSIELASILDKESELIKKVMPALIQVNIAQESKKSGISPESVEPFIEQVLKFKHIKIMGLMTMGPQLDDAQKLRPFFKQAKAIFDRIKDLYGNSLEWKYLSMGMSDSYKIGLEEGANIIRLGTAIFGPRTH